MQNSKSLTLNTEQYECVDDVCCDPFGSDFTPNLPCSTCKPTKQLDLLIVEMSNQDQNEH